MDTATDLHEVLTAKCELHMLIILLYENDKPIAKFSEKKNTRPFDQRGWVVNEIYHLLDGLQSQDKTSIAEQLH